MICGMARADKRCGIPFRRVGAGLLLALLLGGVITHLVAWHFAWHADDANWAQSSDLLLTSDDPVAHIVSWRGQGYTAVRATRGPWNAEAAR
jgi:hypothetical protein